MVGIDSGKENDDSSDTGSGFDVGTKMVYQQDTTGTLSTTIGVALVAGTLDSYRLGNCCEFTYEEISRTLYFNGDPGTVGDQVEPTDDDLESTISADLGTLASGESETIAFCFVMALGNDDADSLANAKAQANACASLYQQITAQAAAIPTLSEWGMMAFQGCPGPPTSILD